MKSLKEILEASYLVESLLADDLDDKIDDVINFQKLMEKPGNLMDFKDLLAVRYKKYKCKIEKSSPKKWREEVERTIKGFNPNKKYIFIVQNPVDRIKRLCIYINDGDKIHKNYLNGIKTNVKILTKYREENISDFLGFYKSTSIYELPEELEWVYDNIANYKE